MHILFSYATFTQRNNEKKQANTNKRQRKEKHKIQCAENITQIQTVCYASSTVKRDFRVLIVANMKFREQGTSAVVKVTQILPSEIICSG